MIDRIRKLFGDEEGLTSVEYALLLALIVVVALATWQALGAKVNSTVSNVTSRMPQN
jgi:Flp pilus assembly pilin Flp